MRRLGLVLSRSAVVNRRRVQLLLFAAAAVYEVNARLLD